MNLIKKAIKRVEFLVITDPIKVALLHKKYGISMGEKCQIFKGVNFGSEPYLISLGNDVKITSFTQFVTHDGGINVLRNLDIYPMADKFGRIKVGNNVFIGIRSIIMPGVTIGDNVVIGAGSIVTHDIPSNSVAVGVPCKVIKSISEYAESLREKIDYTKQLNKDEKKRYLVKKYENF